MPLFSLLNLVKQIKWRMEKSKNNGISSLHTAFKRLAHYRQSTLIKQRLAGEKNARTQFSQSLSNVFLITGEKILNKQKKRKETKEINAWT